MRVCYGLIRMHMYPHTYIRIYLSLAFPGELCQSEVGTYTHTLWTYAHAYVITYMHVYIH